MSVYFTDNQYLKTAEEDFEAAATLRDEIKCLEENKGKESEA